ncbi:MAG: DUF1573 domain-containing protein [Phocaeicola sp.]
MKPYCLFIMLLLMFSSCSRNVKPTEVMIQDPVRHYLPVAQGGEVDVYYRVTNVGKEPLVITDVHSSCGCVALEEYTRVVPVGKEGVIRLKFNSAKNVGHVLNQVRLYGNILPEGVLLLEFDINVVPSSGFIRDYEEYYKEYLEKYHSVEDPVDGNYSYRNYYVSSDMSE